VKNPQREKKVQGFFLSETVKKGKSRKREQEKKRLKSEGESRKEEKKTFVKGKRNGTKQGPGVKRHGGDH